MKQILKKKQAAIIIVAVVMAGGFLVRAYNFHDWLYFKMDQARDANIIGYAITNGPEHLPLLGPRAGATEVSNGYLRLGPAFYYFQYLSGKIFNSTDPEIFAYPDLFFSILTIPLLYFFSRLYFRRKISIFVILMYSFSFIIIQYSRFAWNPNSLLFFTLLGFYGLLKFLRSEKLKSKVGWMAVWAVGTAVGSQLHFLGFFCLPAISFLVIFFRLKPWRLAELIKLKSYFLAKRVLIYLITVIAVFSIIYSPVIISDVIRQGENTKNFLEAFSTKPGKKPLGEKISSSLDSQTKYYCLIATSECYKRKVKDNIGFSFLTALIMISALIALVGKIKKEKDKNRRDFLHLLAIWFGIFFLIAIPLYASLRPRFFIAVFPIPFILLGITFEFLEKKLALRGKYLTVIIATAIIGLNVRGTAAWFKEQSESQKRDLNIDRTLILKNQDGVTLGQMERAAGYMYENRNPGGILYFYVKQEHIAPFKYLFSQKNDPSLIYSTVNKGDSIAEPYFIIVPSPKDEGYIKEDFGANIQILDKFDVGQIFVYRVNPGFAQKPKKRESESIEKATSLSDRVFWRDIFKKSKKQNNFSEGSEEDSDDLDYLDNKE